MQEPQGYDIVVPDTVRTLEDDGLIAAFNAICRAEAALVAIHDSDLMSTLNIVQVELNFAERVVHMWIDLYGPDDAEGFAL